MQELTHCQLMAVGRYWLAQWREDGKVQHVDSSLAVKVLDAFDSSLRAAVSASEEAQAVVAQCVSSKVQRDTRH